MTKAYFSQLADYNIWANQKVFSWFDQIDENQWSQHIPSSFNSIAETALHTVGAEKIWLERLLKFPEQVWSATTFTGSKQDLIEEWRSASQALKKYIDDFDENELHSILHYRRMNGAELHSEYYQIFAHVLNHSTYHRGQLVTMLRQVGFTDVSSTDMLEYFRMIS